MTNVVHHINTACKTIIFCYKINFIINTGHLVFLVQMALQQYKLSELI